MKSQLKNMILISTVSLVILNTTALSVGGDESFEEVGKSLIRTPMNPPSMDKKDVEENPSENPFTGSGDSQGLEIPIDNLFIPAKIGKIRVTYSNKEFFITNGSSQFQVQRHNLSKEIRGIREDQLIGFLNAGYLSVGKSDGEYTLKSNVRLCGGGPFAGKVAYHITNLAIKGAFFRSVTNAVSSLADNDGVGANIVNAAENGAEAYFLYRFQEPIAKTAEEIFTYIPFLP